MGTILKYGQHIQIFLRRKNILKLGDGRAYFSVHVTCFDFTTLTGLSGSLYGWWAASNSYTVSKSLKVVITVNKNYNLKVKPGAVAKTTVPLAGLEPPGL